VEDLFFFLCHIPSQRRCFEASAAAKMPAPGSVLGDAPPFRLNGLPPFVPGITPGSVEMYASARFNLAARLPVHDPPKRPHNLLAIPSFATVRRARSLRRRGEVPLLRDQLIPTFSASFPQRRPSVRLTVRIR